MKYFLLSFFFIVLSFCVSGQDIESVLKADPLKVSGSIGLNSVFYHADNIENRRPTFYWVANASLNLTLFNVISAPFSINYSPQQKDLSYPYQNNQPFNQFGISPKYKSVTVHAGYRSMNFSEFTLSGNKFLGGGIEIKPKKSKWSLQAMSGRFSKAINDTLLLENSNGASYYNRYGLAIKAEISGKKSNVNEFTLFRAWDAQNSIQISPSNVFEAPQENLIVSYHTKRTLIKKMTFELEYAASAYTRDITSDRVNLEGSTYLDNLGVLFKSRASSQYNGALNTTINYTFGKNGVKLGFRRIGPEYTSMGIPFMNNDFQDITLAWNRKIFKQKINLSLSGGLQENNLNKDKVSKMTRVISNTQIAYQVNKKLNLRVNYSNFNSSTQMIRINQLDSLNYYQVTNNVGGGFNYALGKNVNVKKMALANVNYQVASDINNIEAKNMNTIIGYNVNLTKRNLIFSTMLNLNANSVIGFENLGIGPLINISKVIKKKVKLGLSLNQLNYTKSGSVIDRTNNARLNIGYALKKNHQFSFNYTLINKDNFENNIHFSENLFTIQYNYSLNTGIKAKKKEKKDPKNEK